MNNFAKKIHESILDILFSVRCINCKKEGSWICEDCLNGIKLQTEHVCGVCEKMITPDGRTCLACKNLAQKRGGKSSLDAFVPACSYLETTVSKSVHIFKYRFVSDLHAPLGELLSSKLRKTDLPLPDFIVPIPLHPRRLRWRGFNQSALLAKHLSENILPNSKLEMRDDILIRSRYTSPQMEIKDHASRKENISGAFSLLPHAEVQGKTILLVDDIATTGSTIFECAKVLKAAGAKEVFAVVIARQENK